MAREVIAETVRRDRQRDRGEKVEEEEISLGCGDYWEKWGDLKECVRVKQKEGGSQT